MSVHPSLRAMSLLLRTGIDSDRDSEVAILGGSGAPAGGILPNGQVLASAQRAIYLRSDGANVSEIIYVTADGGTNWTAVSVP